MCTCTVNASASSPCSYCNYVCIYVSITLPFWRPFKQFSQLFVQQYMFCRCHELQPHNLYSSVCLYLYSPSLCPSSPVRVFVEFERPHSHSRSLSADAPVLDAVLIALKRRQERNRLALYIDESPLPSQRNEDVPVIRAGALKEMKLPDSGTKQIVITEVLYKPSITDTFGGQSFSPYTEVVFVEGLFCTQTVYFRTWALYRSCLFFKGGQ